MIHQGVAAYVANRRKHEPYDIYVGRPSRYGNPFKSGTDGDRETVVRKYEEWLLAQPDLLRRVQEELAGKVLGCFCAPKLCHAHVLAWHANNLGEGRRYFADLDGDRERTDQ